MSYIASGRQLKRLVTLAAWSAAAALATADANAGNEPDQTMMPKNRGAALVDTFFAGIQAFMNLLDPATTVVQESINQIGQQATGIKPTGPGTVLLNLDAAARFSQATTMQQQEQIIDQMNQLMNPGSK